MDEKKAFLQKARQECEKAEAGLQNLKREVVKSLIYEIPTSAIMINGKKLKYFDFLSSLQNDGCNQALKRIIPRINMAHIPAENSGILHLFESAIDLLSFATLRKMNGIDWKKDHLLSLAGVYQPREKIEESAVPLALTQYLKDHPEIKTIILRLDNDRAGRMAARALMTVLPKHYAISPQFPPRGKDYNDYLCICRGIQLVTRQKEAVR